MRRIAILIVIAISLIGCVKPLTYSHFESMPINGWHQDSVLTYSWLIDDTAATYRILIDVRHTECYPFQNLWFFVNQDTIEFYLADERGQWLGKGHNGYIEMPVLYEEAYKFDSIGEYTMTIQHGMRTEQLRGVCDVGVIVNKNEELNRHSVAE